MERKCVKKIFYYVLKNLQNKLQKYAKKNIGFHLRN